MPMDTKAIRDFTLWFRLKTHLYDQNSCLHCLAAQARAWDHHRRGARSYHSIREPIGEQSDLMLLFGLTEWQAKEVFFGPPGGVMRAQAIAMLEHLAETGQTNWNPPAG